MVSSETGATGATGATGKTEVGRIVVRLDVMLARRKMKSRELAAQVGITEANISLLKSGNVKAVRFSTLCAICEILECQPGDILEYEPAKGV